MYETEANFKTESSAQIPPEVISAFGQLKGKLAARTLISWGEHCTECGWPTCYSTCDLYEAREDLKCRRFVDGMVRLDCVEALNGYLLKISFKRWGKLWARGNFKLYSTLRAERMERRDHWISDTLHHLPLPAGIKRTVSLKRYAVKKRLANQGAPDGPEPSSFLLECYNPQPVTVRLSLTIRSLHSALSGPLSSLVQLAPGFRRSRELTESTIPFQKLIDVPSGLHRSRIPFAEIAPFVTLRSPFSIDITPNDVDDGITLYFGAMDFVKEDVLPTAKEPRTLKCVVWDLDNTLWNGVLVEDGLDKLRLRPGVAEVIRELDQRGILQSVASKNNLEEAVAALRRFQLDTYFLYPQISWGPKSEAIKAVAKSLNIGIDSLLFIDDSEFELQEVRAACHGVKVLNARDYLRLPEMDEFRVPVTAESASRRQMYQVERDRQASATRFGDDYLAFLRSCDIKLRITRLGAENIERVYELTQRTNQMNFSGNRYDRDVLKAVMDASHLDTYVMTCEDRFGSYGVIGFSIVDSREPRLTDLMFSCRIQSKRVEHAFLAYVIRKYRRNAATGFMANYRRTARNAPSGRVFGDLGMQETAATDGVSHWVFPNGKEAPDEGIVAIETLDDAAVGR
jgi:FkbH-like protein